MQRSSGTYDDEQGPQLEARAYETDRRDAECDGARSDQKTCPGRDFAPSNKTVAFPFHGQVDSKRKDDRSNDLKRKVVFLTVRPENVGAILTENSTLKMMNTARTQFAPPDSLPAIVAEQKLNWTTLLDPGSACEMSSQIGPF